MKYAILLILLIVAFFVIAAFDRSIK